MERRALQVILAILSLIPLLGITIGFTKGTSFFLPPGESVTVNLDNQFRYLSGVYGCVTLTLWWVLPKIESRLVPLRIVAAAVFLGGIGRCLSMLNHGPPPDQSMVGGVVLEMGIVPLLVLWQYRLSKRAGLAVADRPESTKQA